MNQFGFQYVVEYGFDFVVWFVVNQFCFCIVVVCEFVCYFVFVWVDICDDFVVCECVLYVDYVDWQQVFVVGCQFFDCVCVDYDVVVDLQMVGYLLFVCCYLCGLCDQLCVDCFVGCQMYEYVGFLVVCDYGICVVVCCMFCCEDFCQYFVVIEI